MKIQKITAADRKRMHGVVVKMKTEEKDQMIADLALFVQRAIPILDELIQHSTLTTKEKRDIEESISLGPQWLNYTRKVKRQK